MTAYGQWYSKEYISIELKYIWNSKVFIRENVLTHRVHVTPNDVPLINVMAWCEAIAWTNWAFYQLDIWEQISVDFESKFALKEMHPKLSSKKYVDHFVDRLQCVTLRYWVNITWAH